LISCSFSSVTIALKRTYQVSIGAVCSKTLTGCTFDLIHALCVDFAPLPTLGGNNGTVGQINNLGEVAGIAENSTRDPECPPGVAFTGTGPQVLDFEAVIWGPSQPFRLGW
jgi:hypothetical protein